MRAARVVTILGGVLCGLSSSGCGSFFAQRDVLRGNQAVYEGIRTRDQARLRELVAPDFKWDAPDGKQKTRDEWLAVVAAPPGEIVSITGLRLRTEMRGDKVTLCGVQHAVLRVNGEEKIDDEPYCNDWQKRDGRWQIVESYVPTF